MTPDKFIPQADPGAGYLSHKAEIDSAVQSVLMSGRYILGKAVSSFERAFSSFVKMPYGIGVASGTDALEIALRALGVGLRHMVFTVSHTAVATVAAVLRCGAVPVVVDIDEKTFTMDPGHLEETVRWAFESLPFPKRPGVVMPVHLYGHPADMRAIMAVAEKYGLAVIEDCAQAHGAAIDGLPVGGFGDISAFSFYPTKNLGAIGDGGMVVTGKKELAEKVLALRQYGWGEDRTASMPGINSRLDELQAAILEVKLRYLEEDNRRRRCIAGRYLRSLSHLPLILPRATGEKSRHVYHLFVIRTPARDRLSAFLRNEGVGTAVHYPVPVHLQPAYKRLCHVGPGGLPITEKICREILSLPMYPELSKERADRVCDALKRYFA